MDILGFAVPFWVFLVILIFVLLIGWTLIKFAIWILIFIIVIILILIGLEFLIGLFSSLGL